MVEVRVVWRRRFYASEVHAFTLKIKNRQILLAKCCIFRAIFAFILNG